MEPPLLAAFKALSDESRLRIVGLLAGGRSMSVASLAEALELTPGTVVHHLKRLSAAGLVESRPQPPFVVYSLRRGRRRELGGQVDALERRQSGGDVPPPDAPGWASAEQARVLRSFFAGERLNSIPAQHAKRLVVLRHLAETAFEQGSEYPEKEVNLRLALRHPDVASLRRYLVDDGFMERGAGIYRLLPAEHWPVG
jgi:ArsR family transcriptional regulator, arsenate/arsenite/antimonite-responsive transcriptional repressor